METIYLDESGYTGGDLLSGEQRTLVLASLWLSEDEASELKGRFFSKVNTPELKFNRIRKSPRQLDAAVNFFKFIATEYPSKMRISFAHKEFVGITKIADLIVEEAYHKFGLDFYKDGYNIAFCNALFLQAEYLEVTTDLIKIFSQFNKSRSYSDFIAFKDFVCHLSLHNKRIKNFADQILGALHCLGYSYFFDLPKDNLDVQGGMAVELVGEWSHFFKNNFNVLYDTSSSIGEQQGMLLELSGSNAPRGRYGRDRRTMVFPLKIDTMKAVDSKQHLGVQLCDVVAGLFRLATEELANPNNSQRVILTKLSDVFDDLNCYSLWPTSDITPNELGTEGEQYGDLLEALMGVRRRSEHGNLP